MFRQTWKGVSRPLQGDKKPPSTSEEEGGIINAANNNYRDTKHTDFKDDTWREVMRLKQIASGLAIPCQKKWHYRARLRSKMASKSLLLTVTGVMPTVLILCIGLLGQTDKKPTCVGNPIISVDNIVTSIVLSTVIMLCIDLHGGIATRTKRS